MNKQELVKEISNANLTKEELLSLSEIINLAIKQIKEKESYVVKNTIQEGMTVTLKGLRPKYLNGRKVKVLTVNRSTVTVEEENPSELNWNKFNSRYKVPLTCIQL